MIHKITHIPIILAFIIIECKDTKEEGNQEIAFSGNKIIGSVRSFFQNVR
jgi:predicted ATPase